LNYLSFNTLFDQKRYPFIWIPFVGWIFGIYLSFRRCPLKMNNFPAIVFGEISKNLVLRLSGISIVTTKKQEGKPLLNI